MYNNSPKSTDTESAVVAERGSEGHFGEELDTPLGEKKAELKVKGG